MEYCKCLTVQNGSVCYLYSLCITCVWPPQALRLIHINCSHVVSPHTYGKCVVPPCGAHFQNKTIYPGLAGTKLLLTSLKISSKVEDNMGVQFWHFYFNQQSTDESSNLFI